jgi:LmbE family N-acetylglucosaminyl deacetylase
MHGSCVRGLALLGLAVSPLHLAACPSTGTGADHGQTYEVGYLPDFGGGQDTGERETGRRDTGQEETCSPQSKTFPINPKTKQVVCPPYTFPAVFIAPHPEAETLLMGGAIKEHLDGGRQVFVELLTHGEASGVRATLADGGECSWHAGKHQYTLTPGAFGDARVAEFMDAVGRLGVSGVVVNDLGDQKVTIDAVSLRLAFWLKWQDKSKGVSFKGPVVRPEFAKPHSDHVATWNALTGSGHVDVRGYGNTDDAKVSAPAMTAVLTAAQWTAKSSALDAYGVWDPQGTQRYAILKHGPAVLRGDAASVKQYLGTEYVYKP